MSIPHAIRSVAWLVAICLLAIPTPVPAADRREEARIAWIQAELTAADSLLAVGRWQETIDRVSATLERHPGDLVYAWQLQERLGVALRQAGRLDESLASLEASARGNSARASVHRNLAATLMELGRRGRALSEFRQALELAPRDCEIRLEFGQVLLEFRNTHEARIHLTRADELCPGRRDVQRGLARLDLADGRPAAAADRLRDLYTVEPTTEVRRTYQQSLQQSGHLLPLYELLRSVPRADLDPTELVLLVETEAQLGLSEVSREYAETLRPASAAQPPIGLDPAREAAFWGRISLTLLGAEDHLPALRAADRAVALAPRNVVYRNNRVVLLTRLGREEDARREWKVVLELDPSLGNDEGSKKDR